MDSTAHGSLDEDDIFEAEYRERVLPPLKRDVVKGLQNGKKKLADNLRRTHRKSRGRQSDRLDGQV
jgi:hypothetical protein